MKINKDLIKKYNRPETLFVISSFPEKSGELALENAVARYSYLLLSNFPSNKKVVVFCEKRQEAHPYELNDSVLVVPTYTRGSIQFALELIVALSRFTRARDLLIQFEFSIFGGKVALPGLLMALTMFRLRGINISFMFHQVIRNLGELSGHLGLKKNSYRQRFLNFSLSGFYRAVGTISNTVIVHDNVLKDALTGLVGAEKISVIPHGCGDTAYLSPNLRREYRSKFGIKKNELIILAYGYLSWYKGTDWIIETIGNLSKAHPTRKIKLLLTGVQSPTLKGTHAYAKYERELSKLIQKNKKHVILGGFIPESEVPGIFAASDVAVFPYRVKMSASGALSVAWQYGKRVLVSREFAKNYKEYDVKTILEGHDVSVDQITFDLNQHSFEEALFELLEKPGASYKVARTSRSIAQSRSWTNVADAYAIICTGNYVKSYLEEPNLYAPAN